MGIGKLQFQIYADNLGQPLSGAIVRITGEGIDISLTSNIIGITDVVELPCPDKEYSLMPQNEIRPYAVYSAVISRSGLITKTIDFIEIFDTITSITPVTLDTEDSYRLESQLSIISEHTLWGVYSPKIVVNPFTQMEPNEVQNVFSSVFIPEFLIVHDGLPSTQNASNYFETFTSYIKNVATSEVYSTWPREAIKANVLCIISFTLTRVFTEWYISKGYNFTITTSTQYDQKYIKDRNIAENISLIVDEIFNNYLVYNNGLPPFFAQYCDGVKVKNPGWLFQWGSKDLADKGYTAEQIINYYYGNNVSVTSTYQVPGIPTSFPGYNLRQRVCGEPVQKVQLQLNIIASSYPLIPKILPADGIYGPKTEQSVKIFQDIFNLPQTGIVDFTTWYKISYIFVSVTNMLSGRYSI